MVLLSFSVTTVFHPIDTEHRHPLAILLYVSIDSLSIPNFLFLDLCPNLSHNVSLFPNWRPNLASDKWIYRHWWIPQTHDKWSHWIKRTSSKGLIYDEKGEKAKAFYIINVNSHLNGKISGEKSVSYITMRLQVFCRPSFCISVMLKLRCKLKEKVLFVSRQSSVTAVLQLLFFPHSVCLLH